MPKTLALDESIKQDRAAACHALQDALRPRCDEPASVYVRREHVRELIDEVEDLRSQVASLKNDLDGALEAVRLHEQQAHERRDVTEELEWRIRGNRLAAAAAM